MWKNSGETFKFQDGRSSLYSSSAPLPNFQIPTSHLRQHTNKSSVAEWWSLVNVAMSFPLQAHRGQTSNIVPSAGRD